MEKTRMFVVALLASLCIPQVVWAQADVLEDDDTPVYTGPVASSITAEEYLTAIEQAMLPLGFVRRINPKDESTKDIKTGKVEKEKWTLIGESPSFDLVTKKELPTSIEGIAAMFPKPGMPPPPVANPEQPKKAEAGTASPKAEPGAPSNKKVTFKLADGKDLDIYLMPNTLGTCMEVLPPRAGENKLNPKFDSKIPMSCMIKITVRKDKKYVMDVQLASLSDVGGPAFLVATYGFKPENARNFSGGAPIIRNSPVLREGLVDSFANFDEYGQPIRQDEEVSSDGKPASKKDWLFRILALLASVALLFASRGIAQIFRKSPKIGKMGWAISIGAMVVGIVAFALLKSMATTIGVGGLAALVIIGMKLLRMWAKEARRQTRP